MLRDFWTEFSGAIGETKDLKISDVIDALDEALGPHFFPPKPMAATRANARCAKPGAWD